jgi:hypothetical protein
MRWALVISIVLVAEEASARPCSDDLAVLSSSATYKTRMFQGKPIRRDATIDLELRSTSTSAVSAIELAVFLGCSLQAVSETRPLTLPTSKHREFEDGGLAFRAELPTLLLQPGETKKLQIQRKALPLEEDVYAIQVVPAACKTLVAVADAVVEIPAAPDEGPPGVLLLLIGVVGLVTVVMILRQLR